MASIDLTGAHLTRFGRASTRDTNEAQTHSALWPGRATAWARRLVFYAVLIVAWNAVVSLGVWPSYVLPGPQAVLRSLLTAFGQGVLVSAAAVSLERIALGYALAVVLGTLLGLLLGRVRLADELLGSLVLGLQSLPSVCWLPLSIVWFGLSEHAILFVVVMGALFSITQGIAASVRSVPPVYIKAARNLGARGWRLYWRVILPAGLPTLLAGLKQGWSFAWRSLMAAELIFFSMSLGNLLQAGRDLNDAARVIAVMLVIMTIGIAFDQVVFAPIERAVHARRGLIPD
jgi:NitT/TauT family transport system permease protein